VRGSDSFVGIDLTAGTRPTAIAALPADLRSERIELLSTDAELVAFVEESGASVVAIDAPLGLPHGQCCLEAICDCQPRGPGAGRACERELSRLGIGCYYTTKRSIIKAMVYRGIGLQERLRMQGCTVLEVYPYATKIRLLGRPLPRKTTAAGRAVVGQGLARLLDRELPQLSHDAADALLCAYTAWLYGRGLTDALGTRDEGQIHVPAILSACSNN